MKNIIFIEILFLNKVVTVLRAHVYVITSGISHCKIVNMFNGICMCVVFSTKKKGIKRAELEIDHILCF